MTWYKKAALIFGCGFLSGMLTLNLVRVLVAEHTISRVLPHAAVFLFFLVIMLPVVRKSRDWFS